MIRGLFEAHIPVTDLERSLTFYTDVVGLTLGTLEEARRIAFCFAGGWNRTMVGLWEKPPSEVHHQHVAFEISPDDLDRAVSQLDAAGLEILNFMGAPSKDPTVLAWMPAVSVYFRDPDGHLLEFLARLPGDPQPERGVVSWSEWNADRG